MVKEKGFIIVYSISIILFLADLICTLATGSLAEHLESNLLYQLTNSFLPIILLNFLLFGLIYWLYYIRQGTSSQTRYFLMLAMIITIFLRVVAIQQAIYWLNNPITVSAASQITTAAKVQHQKILGFIAYVPLLISASTFWLWKLDHEVKRK